MEARSIAYFLQHHELALTDIPEIAQGLCGCLAIWRASGRKSAMVDLALSSTSLAVFSRGQQVAQAAKEASSRYCHLLRMLQERIASLQSSSTSDERENIDACLLTMFLMGRYEATMHHHGPDSTSSHNLVASLHRELHHEGAVTVLKVWTESSSRHCGGSATTIMRLGRRSLIKGCLLRRDIPLPGWILDGRRFGERGLELEYDCILVQGVTLHHEVAMFLRHRKEATSDHLRELVDKARELDDALRDWSRQLPVAWAYRRHTLASHPGLWPRRNIFSPTVYTFETRGFASVWAQYLVTRMLINNARLRIIGICRREPTLGPNYGQEQHLEASIVLVSLADGLASTVPFSVGRIKVSEKGSNLSNSQADITVCPDEDVKPVFAGFVAWQLSIASSLEGVDSRQQQWFRSELSQLGKKLGNGILASAENGEWPML
jgi:hypothetical protein